MNSIFHSQHKEHLPDIESTISIFHPSREIFDQISIPIRQRYAQNSLLIQCQTFNYGRRDVDDQISSYKLQSGNEANNDQDQPSSRTKGYNERPKKGEYKKSQKNSYNERPKKEEYKNNQREEKPKLRVTVGGKEYGYVEDLGYLPVERLELIDNQLYILRYPDDPNNKPVDIDALRRSNPLPKKSYRDVVSRNPFKSSRKDRNDLSPSSDEQYLCEGLQDREIYRDDSMIHLIEMFPDIDPTLIAYIFCQYNYNCENTVNYILDEQGRSGVSKFKLLCQLQEKYYYLPGNKIAALFYQNKQDPSQTEIQIQQIFSKEISNYPKQQASSLLLPPSFGDYPSRRSHGNRATNNHQSNYNSQDYDTYRKDSLAILKKRQVYLQTAQSYYRKGQYTMGQYYQEEANRLFSKYEAQSDTDMRSLFSKVNNNKTIREMVRDGDEIDLHGLQQKEVLSILEEVLQAAREFRRNVVLITGAGNHRYKDVNNVSVIHSAIINYLNFHGISYQEIDKARIRICI